MGLSRYYQENLVAIYHGDFRDILPSITGISAVITDPPYGLGFMGKEWDKQGVSFQADTWRLISEACLPGATLLSFGGTRTSHRIACAIEDAGWQIRDTICWVYGSGFPKSLDISKAIDKKAGVKGDEYIDKDFLKRNPNDNNDGIYDSGLNDGVHAAIRNKPATPEAKLWEGYGIALKPAYEPIIVCMKPIDGTFANNALKHKVAGLNIEACRIPLEGTENLNAIQKGNIYGSSEIYGKAEQKHTPPPYKPQGRFPSNFILGYPEDEYELKDGITTTERENVVKWLYENT